MTPILLQPFTANHTLMRKTLFAAVALAPMWVLASQSAAFAATTITNSISTPHTTAADGDITINSGAGITPTTPGTSAVTIDSSNAVSNAGTISYSNVNSVNGVLMLGGNTGSLTNTGAITVNETYTSSDSNSDGVNEAPYASATSTGRYGVRLTGSSPFVGSIVNSGTITVRGDSSYGISLEAPLTGSVSNSGTITFTGNTGAAFRETAGVSGDVAISGAITAIGQASNAVILGGAVGGRVSAYAAITSTGYGQTTRTTSDTVLQTIQNTASEVQQGGSAMVVSGSVAGGVFLGAAPVYTNAGDTTSDRDGDGIVDSAEATGSVITYGLAPALVIGGATPITIGDFVATPVSGLITGTVNNSFGLIIEGSVEGLGVYDTYSATALQIGGLGGATTIDGGIRISGTVEAQSYAANATGISIGAGATVPTIDNSGAIDATVLPPNTTTSTINAYTAAATGITIAAGANVTNLINSGTISASLTGDSNDAISATAVVDHSGTLSSVTNTGSITANFTADTTGATSPTTATYTALDLSANTTGVTLTQTQAPTIVVTTTTTNSVPAVVVTSTPAPTGALTFTTASTTTTTTNGNVTVETITPASPTIIGDVILGSGPNTVDIQAGEVVGALNVGTGAASSLTIDQGALVLGKVSYSGSALTLNVNNGTLDYLAPQVIKASSVNVGASGILYFGVDPANKTAAQLVVSGPATFATGSKIGLTFVSNATSSQTYNIVSASSLSVDESVTTLTGAVPYMFNAAVTSNAAANSLSLTISPKTPAELGLNPSQAAALLPTYAALKNDTEVQQAFLGQYTKAGFLGVYNQILPDYAGGTFQAANAASQAISRATAEANDIENPSGSRGAWAQELFIGVNQGSGQTNGFQGGGFGFVGGVETGGSGLGAFGLTTAFVSTSIADPHAQGDSQTAMSELELGGYWQGEINGFVADARVGAGYTWMNGRREFVQTNSTGDITLDRKAKSDWDGYTLSGRFGLAYKWTLPERFLGGGWFVQPQSHLDYFRLSESAYSESQTQSIGVLALAVSSRTGQETSGTASILFGRKIGTGIVFRPELELGVRDVFGGDAGDTTARYLSGGSSFTLTPADITGAAGIARIKLKASSEYYELGVEAGGEVLSSRYEEGDVKMSVRVLF